MKSCSWAVLRSAQLGWVMYSEDKVELPSELVYCKFGWINLVCIYEAKSYYKDILEHYAYYIFSWYDSNYTLIGGSGDVRWSEETK